MPERFRAVGFKISQTEFDTLEKACVEEGCSKSVYGRQAILEKMQRTEEKIQLLRDIANWLSFLEQIAIVMKQQ